MLFHNGVQNKILSENETYKEIFKLTQSTEAAEKLWAVKFCAWI